MVFQNIVLFTLITFSTFKLNFCISNGTIAKPHQFPYTVMVVSPQFYCAGTLISTKHVITAAHCLMSIQKGDYAKVYLGAQEFKGGELVLSDKFWYHENFSLPSAVHDIGLIELPENIKISKNVSFIDIETRQNIDDDDRKVVVSGWG